MDFRDKPVLITMDTTALQQRLESTASITPGPALICDKGRIVRVEADIIDVDGDVVTLANSRELPSGEQFRISDPEVEVSARPLNTKLSERETRESQSAFRDLVLEADRYTCVITGCRTKAVLEAAHLPGRDWRYHNEVQDGITLRVDLHRLLDRGILNIGEGWQISGLPDDYTVFNGKWLKFQRSKLELPRL